MPSTRKRETARGSLSRERVLRAAVALADEHGLQSLTMRRLAAELSIEAMTLYHYVSNKDEILGGILDLVVEEMELPAADEHWKSAVRKAAISERRVLLRHPWAPGLLLSGPSVSVPRLQHMNAILGAFRGAGFSAELTDHAYHALDSHIAGFTLWEVGISKGLAQLGSISAFRETLDTAALPYLVEHIEQHLRERGADEKGEFEFGLDLILDGLERLRDEGRAGDP